METKATKGECPHLPLCTLSIGALVHATGIPPETLRTWERRYGTPSSRRTVGGHRLFCLDDVEKLKLIQLAARRGHRISSVVNLSTTSLRSMLGDVELRPAPFDATRWTVAIRALDGRTMSRLFEASIHRDGVFGFIENLCAPLLKHVGEGWAAGIFSVAEEHFVSETLSRFLAEKWRRKDVDEGQGTRVVLATPENEMHNLGLHMGALALSSTDARLLFLGANVPVDDLAAVVHRTSAALVVLSASSHYSAKSAQAYVTRLRKLIPASTRIVVGGAGSAHISAHAHLSTDFRELARLTSN